MCVFFGTNFHTKKNQSYAHCSLLQKLSSPPKSTMSSPVVNVKEGIKTTKQTKTKIGVGCVVKANVGELEKIIRE